MLLCNVALLQASDSNKEALREFESRQASYDPLCDDYYHERFNDRFDSHCNDSAFRDMENYKTSRITDYLQKIRPDKLDLFIQEQLREQFLPAFLAKQAQLKAEKITLKTEQNKLKEATETRKFQSKEADYRSAQQFWSNKIETLQNLSTSNMDKDDRRKQILTIVNDMNLYPGMGDTTEIRRTLGDRLLSFTVTDLTIRECANRVIRASLAYLDKLDKQLKYDKSELKKLRSAIAAQEMNSSTTPAKINPTVKKATTIEPTAPAEELILQPTAPAEELPWAQAVIANSPNTSAENIQEAFPDENGEAELLFESFKK